METWDTVIRQFLRDAGEDPSRPVLRRTPRRFLTALRELTQGYRQDPRTIVERALSRAESHGLVLIRDIAFTSLCEHHLLPFLGSATVAYLPGDLQIGLSKFPRLVRCFAERLQTQERLGEQTASSLQDLLQPQGVAVLLEARHLCLACRGARETNAVVTTQHYTGVFTRDPRARRELLLQLQSTQRRSARGRHRE